MAASTPSGTRASSGARAPRAAGRARAKPTRRQALLAAAQRPVLIPVGAAPVGRENLPENVPNAVRRPDEARRELTARLGGFERRGASARDAVQRELRRRRAQGGRILGGVRRTGRKTRGAEGGEQNVVDIAVSAGRQPPGHT